ncbi:MAG: thioredoxin-disulfide reductase [Ruminococcaceae bacterium]|nr:thioredoxin-disulfide reductase [Oscillospiraceae bacterium]
MDNVYDVLVLGGGPGGYTAAMYAARSGLRTLVLERLAAGGQMALTHSIDNYPGFDEGVDGFTLGMKMQQGAQRFGAETVYADVQSAELDGTIKVLHTLQGTFYGKTVILATGANPRKLGLDGEEELTGRGVHYCAACDGMFYRGKTVMLVGGGNSAVADALVLARVAKKVILVHRRDTLRASKIYHEPLEKTENIEFRWNSEVVSLLQDQRFEGAVIRNRVTGEEETVSCDALFISIGRQPATELFQGKVALDEAGYIVAGESTKTSIPGVYAVGDVRTKAVRQIVTATADGAVAAHEIEEYLALAVA